MSLFGLKNSGFFILFHFITLHVNPNKSERVGELDTSEFCPTFCICDSYHGLNRAVCSSRNLIGSNVELSSAVQILDLSHNDITILDNHCFQNFIQLQYFNLSHNSIHAIHVDAFSTLYRVIEIDLSRNRLEHIDEHIFDANLNLKSLNLAENKFMSLQNKPILLSTSLHTLNLRNCQVTYIYKDMFFGVPNIRELDLSQNLMITLNVKAFNTLNFLSHANLSMNRWNCDRALLNSVEMLRKRAIEIDVLDCNNNTSAIVTMTHPFKNITFERLKMFNKSGVKENVSSLQKQSSLQKEANPKSISLTKVWRSLDALDENLMTDDNVGQFKITADIIQCTESGENLCRKYQTCLHNISMLQHGEKSNQNALGYTVSDLNFAFLMGLSLGITFVLCIMSCALCIKRCCEARSRSYARQNNDCQALMTTQRVSNTLPVTVGHIVGSPNLLAHQNNINNARINSPFHTHHSTSQGRDNFLTRLFGRPARHQYYRNAINRSTASTLVRRLSRSNLFFHRLSQHLVEDEIGYINQNRTLRAPQVLTENIVFCNESEHCSESVETSEVRTLSLYLNRPETPPPSYRDVVVNIKKN